MIKMLVLVVCVMAAGLAVAKTLNKSNKGLKDIGSGFLEVAGVISSNNDSIANELTLYFSSKEEYYKKFEDELYQRDITSADEIPDVVVLVEALVRSKMAAYLDVSSELDWSLKSIGKLAAGKLDDLTCFKELLEFSKSAKYGLGSYLQQEGNGPSISKCVDQAGLALRGIDEDSDSYVLVVVPKDKVPDLEASAKKAGIRVLTFL